MPHWTALDRFGQTATGDGAHVTLDGKPFTARPDLMAPVYATDPETGMGLLAYRAFNGDSCHVLASTGWTAELSDKIEGKWAIGIACSGPGRFLVAWIHPGKSHVSMDEIDCTQTPPVIRHVKEREPIEASLLILEVTPAGIIRTEGYDGQAGGFKYATRNGIAIAVLYWTERNGRVVGVDASPNAPNRVLLADHDDFYVVSDDPRSAFYPPQLDESGNVVIPEHLGYFSNQDIRTRPLVPTPVPTPTPDPCASVKQERDKAQGDYAWAIKSMQTMAQEAVERHAEIRRLTDEVNTAKTDLSKAQQANLQLRAELAKVKPAWLRAYLGVKDVA